MTRTPDEIKKGLECCGKINGNDCGVKCPYTSYLNCMENKDEDALALIQQLEARAPRWISVEDERKPRNQQECLCVCALDDDPEHKWDWQMVLRWHSWTSDGNGGVIEPHFTDEGVNGMIVTHWMPLPEPPKEGNEC